MLIDHNRRLFRILAGVTALSLAISVPMFAQGKDARDSKEQEKKSDEAVTSLRVEVTGGDKDDGVENASVYVKFQHERTLAKDKTIEMNVKTNREGVAKVPSVPRGKILVQVIAPGWKTFGQWYELNSAEQTIRIKLQRPPRWY